MTVYDMLMDFAFASILIMVGQLLRSKVHFFQTFFIPASMLAGFIGLLLGDQVLGILPFSGSMGSYAGVLVILIFAIVGINGFKLGTGKGSGAEEVRRVAGFQFYRMALFYAQFCIPIAVCLLVLKRIVPGLNDGFGVLLASGFIGGHGTAAAVGSTLESLGWAEGTDIGMTFATIGILTGVFGGVAMIKLATKKGYTSYIKDFKFISKDMRTGMVAKENRSSMGEESISSVSLDTLAFHLSVVLGVSGIGYLVNTKLIAIWLPGVPSYTVAFLLAILFFLTFRKTPVYDHIDRKLNSHISGTCTDYVVFFGIASIKLAVVVEYALPLIVMTLLGFLCVFGGLMILGPLTNRKSWFERSIFCYGYGTGVFAIGFVLLRIVDPDNKSKTVEDTAMTPFLSFTELFVWSLVPTMLVAGQGWTVVAVTAAVFIGSILICMALKCWYPGLPLANRGGYDDEAEMAEENNDEPMMGGVPVVPAAAAE